MNSIHYDVILFTKEPDKAVSKINELITDNKETLFKSLPYDKYITDKRTYKIVSNYEGARGYRYFEAYIDKSIDQETIEYCILPFCMPIPNNRKERIHNL